MPGQICSNKHSNTVRYCIKAASWLCKPGSFKHEKDIPQCVDDTMYNLPEKKKHIISSYAQSISVHTFAYK